MMKKKRRGFHIYLLVNCECNMCIYYIMNLSLVMMKLTQDRKRHLSIFRYGWYVYLFIVQGISLVEV